MKAHELLNVLNHFHPHAEWNGGDVLQTPDGKQYSLSGGIKSHRQGRTVHVPVKGEVTQSTHTEDDTDEDDG